MQTKNLQKILCFFFLLLIGCYYTVLAVKADSDLSVGRYVLFMDEHLTFDGVQAILHPPSLKKLMSAILHGEDHRYGRILWNVSAFFSLIPERLYGPQGQIIATRMVQFTALLAAYLLLVFTLIKSWPLRVLGFLSLLSIPTTCYYASMPKPEPLQLLFLAIFLWQSKKRQFAFGKHWIFLGLAFGAKISVFFLIFFFALISFLQRLEKSPEDEAKDAGPKVALRFFLLGFLIAEPVFLLTFRTFDLRYFHNYLQWTFLSIGHGSDDLNLTWLSWLKFIFKGYTNIPEPLLILTILCAGILFSVYLKSVLRQFETFKNINSILKNDITLVILLASFILIVPIILFVKRLDPPYLHNGMVFLAIGVLNLVEGSINAKEGECIRFDLAKVVSFVLCGLLLIGSLFYLTPLVTKEYIRLSKRTQEECFMRQLNEYNYVTDTLTKISNKLGRKVQVFFDTHLFLPSSNEKFELERFYGFFTFWSRGKDILVIYKSALENHVLLPKTSISYNNQLDAVRLLKEHVSLPNSKCKASPCYYRLRSKMDNISIFINSELYGALGDREEDLK